jgi:hypothetical protein
LGQVKAKAISFEANTGYLGLWEGKSNMRMFQNVMSSVFSATKAKSPEAVFLAMCDRSMNEL